MRWLLIDEVVSIQKGVSAVTKSRIPSLDASSELLMIEMMAQTGGMLLGAFDDYTTDVIFAKIENAQFSSDWQAGEPIEISATSENLRTEGAWIDGEIKNESGCVAKARLLLMNAGKLNAAGDSSTTFHPAFMNHFKIREKVR